MHKLVRPTVIVLSSCTLSCGTTESEKVSSVAEHDTTEPTRSKPDASVPVASEPDASGVPASDTQEPDTSEPDTPDPDASGPGSLGPADASGPNTSEPGAPLPDTSEPEPDTPEEKPSLELDEGVALTQVVAGERLCGLDESGRVLCEGGGFEFEKPVVQLVSSSPNHMEDLLCMRFEGGEVECSYSYYSDAFVGYTAIDLSLSYQTALIVTEQGQIIGSWGRYLDDEVYQKVIAGVDFGCGLDEGRGLTCFLLADEGLARPPSERFVIVFEVPDGNFASVYANDLSAYAPFCGLDAMGWAQCWWLRNAEGRPSPLEEEEIIAVEAFAPDLQFSELAVGARETCGIDDMRSVVCWNHAENGAEVPALRTPIEVEAVAITVSTNGQDFCVLDGAGRPLCWGR